MLTFGLGTLTESINAIFGWSEMEYQDLVYRRCPAGRIPAGAGNDLPADEQALCRYLDRRRARRSFSLPQFVYCSRRFAIPEGFDQRLTGRVFAWQWVRAFSPLPQPLRLRFLFGGAVYSAIQYFAKDRGRTRFLGNILIAIGALLPGIGGTFTRFGYVEVLYVTEFDWTALSSTSATTMMRKDHSASLHANQQALEGVTFTQLIRVRPKSRLCGFSFSCRTGLRQRTGATWLRSTLQHY